MDIIFWLVENLEMGMSKNEDVKRTIDDCLTCYRVCVDASAECLKMGGKHVRAGHVTLLNACAQACMLSADYMLKRFLYNPQMCGLCASICDKCAESCENFTEDFMKECAVTCRKCAESCRRKANR